MIKIAVLRGIAETESLTCTSRTSGQPSSFKHYKYLLLPKFFFQSFIRVADTLKPRLFLLWLCFLQFVVIVRPGHGRLLLCRAKTVS